MVEIRRWDNNDVIHTIPGNSVKKCLEDGVAKGVTFYRALLFGASLGGALLKGASLDYAYLDYALLNGALLNGASLNGASLNRALLNGTSLNDASYSISTLLKISWGVLPDNLTLELMRHDAEYIGYEDMDTWAAGGACPYRNKIRDFHFNEKRKVWKRGKPKLRGRELFFALCKARKIKISL